MQKAIFLFGRASRTASCWLFLATLIAAPWLFGATRDWSIQVVLTALFSVAGLWLAGLAGQIWSVQRRLREGVSQYLLVLSGLLALLGWSVAVNAESYFDPYLLELIPIPGANEWWPGTVEGAASGKNMIRISALLMALLFSSHLASRPLWRRRMFTTIAATGISIALFGLAQKVFGEPLLFWEPERFSSTNFAMYRYHANAAAYLNLTWPFSVAFALEAFQTRNAFVSRALWLPGTLVIIAGLFVNVSKGGHLVALLMMLAWGLVFSAAKIWQGDRSRVSSSRHWLPAFIVGVLFVMGLVVLIGPEGGLRRWAELFENTQSQTGRILMPKACLEIARDRPWFGFGPGTFATVFPFYSHLYGDSLAGIWRYAHCDYLQTLVEWGIVGCLLWGGIFFGGITRCVLILVGKGWSSTAFPSRKKSTSEVSSALRRSVRLPPSSRHLFDGAVLVGLSGVAIHAAFDFPLQIASIQLYVAALTGYAWRSSPSALPENGL